MAKLDSVRRWWQRSGDTAGARGHGAGQRVAATPTDSRPVPAMDGQPVSSVAVIGRKVPPPQVTTPQAVPRTEAHPPADHARALLTWLQSAGGRTGTVPARDLVECHTAMLAELEWSPVPWNRVAIAFRKLIGTPKQYAYIDRVRTVVYHVPTAAQARERLPRPSMIA